MNPIGYLPYLVYQNRRDELINEAEKNHLLNEAMQANRSRTNPLRNLLARLGKELSPVGFSREVGINSQPELKSTWKDQGELSGCA